MILIVLAGLPATGETTSPPTVESVPEEIAKRVGKSVVAIHVVLADETRNGSGFVVRPDGIIATNLQLILEARAVRVRFSSGDEVDAVGWVANSPINNLALIQCPLPKDVAPLELCKSLPPKDVQVFAISRSSGPEATVVEGRVTGISQAAAGHGDQTPPAAVRILTNIDISPFQSGGPLIDRHGAVVGICQESDKYALNPNAAVSVEPLREPLGRIPLKTTPSFLPPGSIPEGPLDSAVAYSNRARLRWSKGEVDASIADYTEAIRLDPHDAENYHERGVSWMNKCDYDRASADFTEAIRLAPKNPQTLFLRGTAWINKKDFPRAIADLNKSITIDPTHPPAYGLRGYAQLRIGDYDRAIADLDEAIRLEPDYDVAYLHRGMAWSKKGDKVRAEADFKIFNRRPGSRLFDTTSQARDPSEERR
jgi:hypothetical protein